METYLIEHCSPTLASIKPANLFTYIFTSKQELMEDMQKLNQIINEKGVYVEILRIRDGRALIWVYRKSQLEQSLQEAEVIDFLKQYGYQMKDFNEVIAYLKERVMNTKAFPHEIGVFLGYPLADVKAFIEHSGKNSKCTGCWKVYTDECKAIRLFEKYEKCKLVYTKMFLLGKSVMQLTVAA